MNKNINLVDILKECPRGYKIYSTIYGEVEFVEIINNCITKDPIIYKYKDYDGNYYVGSTTIDGKFTAFPDGECTLFPSKYQRDWSKFKVEPEMVDGKFYYCDYKGRKYIFIYKKKDDLYKTNNYAIIRINESPCLLKQNAPIYCGYLAYFDELRNATEEEKQQLLNVIKRDGYKWDEETKTLEKIIVSHTPEKFYIRIGEIPSNEKSKVHRGDVVVGYEDGVSVYDCIETDGLYRIVMPFPLKEGQGMTYEGLIQEITQCRYEIENPRNVYLVSGMEVGKGHDNEPVIKDVKILKDLTGQFNTKPDNTEETKILEELTVPKFKVGDFKLVPDKFDINTLQPFDKILCRVDNSSKWRCEFFSHFCNICYKFFCSGGLYTQCIPYNEETKHLVGKNEKPPKKYITWEE